MGGEGKERATNCVRPPGSFPLQTIRMVRDMKLARTAKRQRVFRDVLWDMGGQGDPREGVIRT